MKLSRRAVILGSLGLLAERLIGRIARADLASQESVLSAAVDVYIYGYPLAIMDMDDRYFMMPMLSGWTDVFQAPGTRTTGQRPQTYVVTGPGGPAHFPRAPPNTNRQPALSGYSAAFIAPAPRRIMRRFTRCRTKFRWSR